MDKLKKVKEKNEDIEIDYTNYTHYNEVIHEKVEILKRQIQNIQTDLDEE